MDFEMIDKYSKKLERELRRMGWGERLHIYPVVVIAQGTEEDYIALWKDLSHIYKGLKRDEPLECIVAVEKAVSEVVDILDEEDYDS